MENQLNDEEVIRMYLNTRQSSYFETLYKRYVSQVYRRCLKLTKDSANAQDYTHDIFLRVHGNLPLFKERSAFSTWLYSISYNYCMDQIRHAKRKATVVLENDQEYQFNEPIDVESGESQFHQLAQVMRSVTPEEAQLLYMKYDEGLDIREIARHLNLKDSAVKMRLKRTRDKIKRLYSLV